MDKIMDAFDTLVTAYVELICCAANEYDAGAISHYQMETLGEAGKELRYGLTKYRNAIKKLQNETR